MKKTNHTHTTSLSRQDRKEREKRRFKAGKLFEKGKTQTQVARKLDVSCEAARQWHSVWKKHGQAGLKSKGKPGPKPKLTEGKLKKVEQALFKGPKAFGYATEIWTLRRIKAVMQKVVNVNHHESYVWKILTNMGWSSQKPIARPIQRNEKAIVAWKRRTWPAIKKKRKNSVQS